MVYLGKVLQVVQHDTWLKEINVIWSSWISRLSAILILRYSPSKKTLSFVSYCFWKPSLTHISGTMSDFDGVFSKIKLMWCTYTLRNSKLNVTDLQKCKTDFTWSYHKWTLCNCKVYDPFFAKYVKIYSATWWLFCFCFVLLLLCFFFLCFFIK